MKFFDLFKLLLNNPVAEELSEKRYMGIGMCSYEYSNKEIDSIIFAFKKVWDNIEILK